MGKHNGPGGYQTRPMGLLVYVYPISGVNAFRPSGDPARDGPEEFREDYYSTAGLNLPKTRQEQAQQDLRLYGRTPRAHICAQEWAYWDNIRFKRIEEPNTPSRPEAIRKLAETGLAASRRNK